MTLNAPRGTEDTFNDEIAYWHVLEQTARTVFDNFYYREIRTPVFEDINLFVRSIGQTTDIVEKEMFTLATKSDDETPFALRPEATASVVRAYLEHNLYKQLPFQKFYYIGPMFRYERPQAGRLRQFHQLGVEALGSYDAYLDVEVVLVIQHILRRLHIEDFSIQINSIGCPDCRPAFRDTLRAYFGDKLVSLCPLCKKRYERNVFRILDCKEETCSTIASGAPEIYDYLCDGCRSHFEDFKTGLTGSNVDYTIQPHLVRGLDYYTKSVFEVSHPALGAKDVVAAGGRYDNLVSDMGGPETGAVGFSMGMERAILILKTLHEDIKENVLTPPIFLVKIEKEVKKYVFALMNRLRSEDIPCEMDWQDRSVKAQMRQANRINARFVLVVGKNEMDAHMVTVKNMLTGKEESVSTDDLIPYLRSYN